MIGRKKRKKKSLNKRSFLKAKGVRQPTGVGEAATLLTRMSILPNFSTVFFTKATLFKQENKKRLRQKSFFLKQKLLKSPLHLILVRHMAGNPEDLVIPKAFVSQLLHCIGHIVWLSGAHDHLAAFLKQSLNNGVTNPEEKGN